MIKPKVFEKEISKSFKNLFFVLIISSILISTCWSINSNALQNSHKFATVSILPDKSSISPFEDINFTVGLDAIATPSFVTVYNRCIVRPYIDSDFVTEFGDYENDYTPNLRFSFDLVVEFLQNNQVISGPYFLSLAMLHNGTIVSGKQDGSDMQLYSVDSLFNNESIYSKQLDKIGTIPLLIKGRSAYSYPLKVSIPSTGDVYAQYFFAVSQLQTFDMSSESKKSQNYKCGGITNSQDLYFSGRQVFVLSTSNKLTQFVSTFTIPKSAAINLQALQLKATANTGNPVQFNSLTPNVCLTNNEILIFRNTGKCRVEAIALESSKYSRSSSLVKEIQIVPKGAKYEILCKKGNNVKSVVSTRPKCPIGYIEV